MYIVYRYNKRINNVDLSSINIISSIITIKLTNKYFFLFSKNFEIIGT